MAVSVSVEAPELDENTAFVVLHAPPGARDWAPETLDRFVEAVRRSAPQAWVVLLNEGESLETVSKADMAAAGWRRIPTEPGPHPFLDIQRHRSTCVLITGPNAICGKGADDPVHAHG